MKGETAPGTISAHQVSIQPVPPCPSSEFPPNSGMCRAIRNTGITVAYNGIMMHATIQPNTQFDSRNVSFASERSEEHTSELQSRFDLVCRLLLEKKKTNKDTEHACMATAPQ